MKKLHLTELVHIEPLLPLACALPFPLKEGLPPIFLLAGLPHFLVNV